MTQPLYQIVDENHAVIDGLDYLTLPQAEQHLTRVLNEGADAYIAQQELEDE